MWHYGRYETKVLKHEEIKLYEINQAERKIKSPYFLQDRHVQEFSRHVYVIIVKVRICAFAVDGCVLCAHLQCNTY